MDKEVVRVRTGRTNFDVDSFTASLPNDDRYYRPINLMGPQQAGFLVGADLGSTFVYEHLWEGDLDLDNPNAEEQCSAIYRITRGIEFPGTIISSFRRTSLSPELRDEVLRIINAPDTCMAEAAAGCFEPHHTIVFHNGRSQVIGYMELCFLCRNYQYSVIRSQDDNLGICERDWPRLTELLTIAGMKDPVDAPW